MGVGSVISTAGGLTPNFSVCQSGHICWKWVRIKRGGGRTLDTLVSAADVEGEKEESQNLSKWRASGWKEAQSISLSPAETLKHQHMLRMRTDGCQVLEGYGSTGRH